MPLPRKGQEVESKMEKQYGPKKGKSVFYASLNSGKLPKKLDPKHFSKGKKSRKSKKS
jgi:hypothetical protein